MRKVLLFILLCSINVVNAQTFNDYIEAAEQGDANAQAILGAMYLDGNGVKRDYTESIKWFGLSADQDNPIGLWGMGIIYFRGYGMPQNQERAFGLFKKSAEQGFVAAQSDLAVCYENGKGVALDYKEAVHWYKLAAEQGHSGAQLQL